MFRCNRLRGIAAAATLLFALPACGGDDDGTGPDAGGDGTGGDDGDTAATPAPAPTARSRIRSVRSRWRRPGAASHPATAEGQEPDPSFRALLLAGAMDGD